MRLWYLMSTCRWPWTNFGQNLTVSQGSLFTRTESMGNLYRLDLLVGCLEMLFKRSWRSWSWLMTKLWRALEDERSNLNGTSTTLTYTKFARDLSCQRCQINLSPERHVLFARHDYANRGLSDQSPRNCRSPNRVALPWPWWLITSEQDPRIDRSRLRIRIRSLSASVSNSKWTKMQIPPPKLILPTCWWATSYVAQNADDFRRSFSPFAGGSEAPTAIHLMCETWSVPFLSHASDLTPKYHLLSECLNWHPSKHLPRYLSAKATFEPFLDMSEFHLAESAGSNLWRSARKISHRFVKRAQQRRAEQYIQSV